MKADLSLRVNIFVIAVVVVILGQSFYSYFNLQSFQASYIKTLQDKSSYMGRFLREDIQHVLELGIPLENISGLEKSLAKTMDNIPEAGFIEIVDPEDYLLYRADRKGAEKKSPKTKRGRFRLKPYAPELARMGLSPQDTDITIPLTVKQEITGYINIHISGSSIQEKSRQILWDMLTVMLVSLLLTFELLTFFVVYYIKHPLDVLRRDIAFQFPGYRQVNPEKYKPLGEIGVLAKYYNAIIKHYLGALGSGSKQKQFFGGGRQELQKTLARQDAKIDGLFQKTGTQQDSRSQGLQAGPPAEKLRDCFHKIKKQFAGLEQIIGGAGALSDPSVSLERQQEVSGRTPHSLIRPLVFLFIMADGFSLSFFPMFVDSMYEPFLGLSREMIAGLPISAFMLVLAISMPLAGDLTDSRGWHKPLILGLVINAAGHVLTAMAQDITQLIAFRALTAIGFGIVFISCQRFIIDNTSARTRAMGMSRFLAAFFSGDICGTVTGAMLAERIGYAPVFYVSAFFSGLALVFLLIVFRGSFRPAPTESSGNTGMPFSGYQLVKVFKDLEFSSLVWLQAIPAKLALVGFLFFFVPLYLNNINSLQSNIGRVIMCYSICIIFIGPVVSYFFPQQHLRKYLVAAGGLLTAAAMLCFTFTSGLLPLLFIVIMLGVGQSMSVPSQAAIISETNVVKQMGSGTGMGIYRFWERAGNVIGPLFMGFLIARTGYENSVVALGFIILVCSLAYLVMVALKTGDKGRKE
ncbi:MAG: MFS transporter [Desulfobacteraceae bacterium]|nr:MFS transporter [Desulfobacteraceae bacterium]